MSASLRVTAVAVALAGLPLLALAHHGVSRYDMQWDGILMEAARADGSVLKVNRPRSLGGP